MSTIASPRPSIALSRRTSTSTDRSVSATRHAGPGPATGTLRRNRAALRDFYNLKNSNAEGGKDVPPTPTLDPEIESELDKDGFDPEQYVKDILAREGLEGVMRVEAGLVSEIRTLDGEKKALVYDNYSKLIAATDTIRKMLTPAIGHIAETATALSESLRKQHGNSEVTEARKKQEQQELVRWVLDAPCRLSKLVEDGQREEAEAEWNRVSGLLDKWAFVPGANDVRQGCEKALEDIET
jgi:hypothetical protein